MRMMVRGAHRLTWPFAFAALAASACAGTQAAAARDPLRCERDPACTERSDKSKDCVTQCVDDPACIDRCREVTGQFR
jgi:hypothetical protein